VPDDAETLIASDEEAGKITGDRAKHDPRNDAHENLHPLLDSVPREGTLSLWPDPFHSSATAASIRLSTT
jgi:hypothetical protein